MMNTTKKKPPREAKGNCTICKGWINDGRGGTCVFTDDFYVPHCPYDEKDNLHEHTNARDSRPDRRDNRSFGDGVIDKG